ncbi:DUF2911 domain-containing protein [Tenacibaculum geojense]|uniref:DUF2911 domain-containing protein n=1 Tax=Tenacibaculum geojense TaxID=915352 RepID=A0ABW3JQF1_9FLAO
MKKVVAILVLVFSMFLGTNVVSAQEFEKLNKSPMDAASYPSSYRETDKVVKVIYSRPQLKGRKINRLIRNGKIWRTGANEATEITFYKDVEIAGKPVKAGTYTLYTIPGDDEWTIIINSALNVWGSYMYNESEDVVRVKGKVTKGQESLEAFSVAFTGEDENFTMHLGWGTTRVSVPFKG